MSGLYLVQMLCAEIDGSLEYDGSGGAKDTVTFSLA
jgi:hypothetical protein